MSPPSEDRVRALIAEATALLARGLGGEAADIFGRVLLLDPDEPQARAGLERCEAMLAERRRRAEARLDEAARALASGRGEAARTLVEQALREGGDRDRAQPLLDRLDDRAGRLDGANSYIEASGGDSSLPPRRRLPHVSRRAMVAAWTVAFVTLAVGLAFSWDSLVDTLVSNPAPVSVANVVAAGASQATAGEIAVGRARDMMARGDLATALVILDEVEREDAEYPFARRLRAQVLAATPQKAQAR